MTKHKSSTFKSVLAAEKDKIESIPSQSPSLQKDTKDTLIDWQLEREIQILVALLIIGIIVSIGFLNRRVENALFFALFLSGIIIAIFLALLF